MASGAIVPAIHPSTTYLRDADNSYNSTGRVYSRADNPTYDQVEALRVGDWKIVAAKDSPWELYNLADDRSETKNLAAKHPQIQVTVLEKSPKLLSKVKVSGGGRCNVTNSCIEPRQLIKNYPRSNKKLAQAFAEFGTEDTVLWFDVLKCFSKRNTKCKK